VNVVGTSSAYFQMAVVLARWEAKVLHPERDVGYESKPGHYIDPSLLVCCVELNPIKRVLISLVSRMLNVVLRPVDDCVIEKHNRVYTHFLVFAFFSLGNIHKNLS
jgi:hypothetical protein